MKLKLFLEVAFSLFSSAAFFFVCVRSFPANLGKQAGGAQMLDQGPPPFLSLGVSKSDF